MKKSKTLKSISNENSDIVTIYCFFDDLCKSLDMISHRNSKGGRPSCLNLPEVLTILLIQKEYCIENKKALWKYIINHHKKDFPRVGKYVSFCLA